MRKCDKCGEKTYSFFKYEDLFICDHCYIARNPPKIKLIIFESLEDRPLFNSTLRAYEPVMNVEDFVKCGWFVREKRLRKGFTLFYLEYHGKVLCSKCPDAVAFPLNYKRCENFMECKNQITRIGTEHYVG